MKEWSYWFPDVLPKVPGCPLEIVEYELRKSAQAFFRGSYTWKTQEGPLPLAALQETLAIVPDNEEVELLRVEPTSLFLDGRRLTPMNPQTLDNEFVDDWRDHTGQPDEFYELEAGIIRFYPIPVQDAVTGLKLRCSVVPKDTATGLPDNLATRYREEIYIGALARLMLMKNKPWTDLDMAQVYGGAFGASINKWKSIAARAGVEARITARSRSKWC